MRIPNSGKFYSVSQGYYSKFDLEMRSTIVIGSPAMVDELQAFIERYSALPL